MGSRAVKIYSAGLGIDEHIPMELRVFQLLPHPQINQLLESVPVKICIPSGELKRES
jgi:hypothetical protein